MEGRGGRGGREGVSKQLLRGEERVEGASEGLNDNVEIHSACSLTHKRCSCKRWPRTHTLTCLASLLRVATALPAMTGAVRTVREEERESETRGGGEHSASVIDATGRELVMQHF